ncbi:hypothetical protein ACOSQ3_024289 [Xanthoceras sorbifolium]
MSMAAESSSTIHKSDSMMSSLPASIQSLLIVKVMTFNLLIKLNLLIHALNGLGHEYDPVVVLVSQQSSISFHVAQYMLIIHEQRIEHLSSTPHIDAPPSANFADVLLMVVDETTIIEGREVEVDGIIPTLTDLPQHSVIIDMIEIPIKVHLSLLNVLCRFILKLVLILCMVLLHTMCNTTII